MLSEMQARLEDHFRALSSERAPHGFPVYAFEHGLQAAEIDAIRKNLCSELARNRTLEGKHWLLWIVVAAEIGYTYDGDEYWRSFASEVPEWVRFGDRDTVRDWFRKFKSRFAGFTPSGRWADHFAIIAWPITHSILPRYLQSQFARHLHDLRFDLAAMSEVGMDQLGELLSERYDGGSSRFENFLQQTALTARLVLALRDEDVQEIVSPIHRPTLARIVADLESRGSSRGYLRDARRVLRDARVRAERGLGGYAANTANSSLATNTKIAAKGIKLIGRESAEGSWTLGVALPDFASILQQTGLTVAALDKTRMRFADKPTGWMAGRALLAYSGRDHPLGSLPAPLAKPVIEFEGGGGAIGRLSEELKILTRSPWLLRIHDDDVARQVLGNHVRTNEHYLIATTSPVSPDVASVLGLQLAVSRTSEITLYRMDAPSVATPPFLLGLAKLMFGYALRAQVQPVGLVPRWDASIGSSVWLPTEEILLRLSADFDVTEFTVSTNLQTRTRFPVVDRNELLISLGTLPIGRHVVEIAATSSQHLHHSKAIRPAIPETIFIEVRPPAPWQQAVVSQAGFRVVLDPAHASFADLAARRASLSVHGPPARLATAEVRLFDANGHLSEAHKIGTVVLPASGPIVARLIDQLSREPLSERIQSSPRVDIAFSVEELGVGAVSFPRKVSPVRWKLDTHGSDRIVRLIDEAGVGSQVSVDRFDIEHPDTRIAVELQQCLNGITPIAPGALFVAHHAGRRYSAVVSVARPGRLTSLSELGVSVTLSTSDDSPRRMMRLLAFHRNWRGARALGPLAPIRKATVLEAFEHQMARLACGRSWADHALEFRRGSKTLMDRLQREVGGSPGFASRMKTTVWNWFADSRVARAEFINYAITYKVSADRKLCDLALRLAFQPASIRIDDPDTGAEAFQQLASNPTLARGAFLAKLISDLNAANDHVSSSGGQQ